MSYSVVLSSHAARDLRRLPKEVRERIISVLEQLAENPRPHRWEKIKGSSEWRVRVGDYRVRYQIDDAAKIVTVTRVDHRKAIYEG